MFIRNAIVAGVMTGVMLLVNSARDLVIAYAFGVSGLVDSFLIAILLPNLAVQVVAGSLNTAMMPILIKTLEFRPLREAQGLIGDLTGWAVLGLLGATILTVAIGGTVYGFSGEATVFHGNSVAFTLFGLAVPLILMQGISVFWAGLSNARGKFALAAVAPAFRSLGVIVAIGISRILAFGDGDPRVLIGGLLFGVTMEFLAVGIVTRRLGFLVLPRWLVRNPACVVVLGEFLPAAGSMILMNGALFTDQVVATSLDPGSVAALNYATKVGTLVIGLSAVPLSTVLLPYFSTLLAREPQLLLRRLLQFSVIIMFVSIPVTIILYHYSLFIVTIIFRHGAFTTDSAELVATTQCYYLLQLPFYITSMLGVRALSAMSLNRLLTLVAGINFFLNLFLDLLLGHFMGLPGIGLATSVMYAVAFFMIFSIIFYKAKRLPDCAMMDHIGTETVPTLE